MAKGISIDLIVDPKKAIQGLNETEQKASGVSTALGKLGGVAAAGLKAIGVASLAAGAATAAFLVKSVEAAGESQKVAAQTQAVLKSTAGAAGQTEKSIGSLATRLSMLSGVDDEVVQAGENILLTFTNIRGANFDKATQSALDMSTALGTDLNGSAILVGKALNDPLKGLTALTRVGVSFTDQQKKQIAAMVKAGDVAGAQGVILAELSREFGGSAKAFGDTWQGAVGKVKTAFGNIQEAIGGSLLPALSGGANGIAGILNGLTNNPRFNAWLADLGSGVSKALKPLTDFLTKVAESKDPLGTLVDGLSKVSPLFAVLKGVFDALKPYLPEIKDGIEKIAVAMGGGLAGLTSSVGDSFGKILKSAAPLAPSVGDLASHVVQLVPPLARLAEEILPLLVPLLESIIKDLGFLVPVVDFLTQSLTASINAISGIIGVLKGTESITDFGDSMSGLGGIVGTVYNAITNFAIGILRSFGDLVVGAFKVATDLGKFFSVTLPKQIGDALGGISKWLVDSGKSLVQGLLDGISSKAGKIGKFFLNLLPDWIVGPFKAALGIHSPSTVFAGYGSNMVAGLVNGLRGGYGVVASATAGLSGQVAGAFNGSLTVDAARASLAGRYGSDQAAASPVSAAVPPINQQIYVLPEQDPRIVGRQFGREFARAIAGSPA